MAVRSLLRQPAQLRTEVLAGLVVALALIPEAIAFSVIAGVDPRVGLFASFTMAVSIAFLGGRPAMISAATGAVALVIAPVMANYGYDHLIATVILAGLLQGLMALCGVTKLLRFIPRSVMLGFVNSLALLVLYSQLTHVVDVPWQVYPMVAVGIVLIVLWPRVTTAVPAPLVAVAVLTVVAVLVHLDVPTVGDEGRLPDSLPGFFVPDLPWNFETLRIVAPYALAMALVGLLESLLTATLVDDITDTTSSKRREAAGQGAANVITGFFGGLGGCAVIGQTMMNVKVSGARTRLSTFLAGVFLLVLVVGFGTQVAAIPMAALVAVMVMVSVAAFDWDSVRPSTLARMPRSETAVMLVTMAGTLITHNLAIGVVAGSLLAAALLVRRLAQLTEVTREEIGHGSGHEQVVYRIRGELCFASSNQLPDHFRVHTDPADVIIDLSAARVWDASSVAVLDGLVDRYAARGTLVELVGLTGNAAHWHRRLSGHLSGD